MQFFKNMTDWRTFRATLSSSSSLGFVPTMGNLHEGHASLFRLSQQENDYTVVSLFVNPTQFNQPEDFLHYPRTLEADMELLQKMQVDYCVIPDEAFIYADNYCYQLQETHLSQLMEGKHRPGHFNGVLTVVMKLLNLIKPQRAYFGEKDFQQYELIRDMVSAFFMDVEIKVSPTVRETSGLAFSSRNRRLNAEEYCLAQQFAHIFQNLSREDTLRALQALNIQVEYLEEYNHRRYIAVKIGSIRLIDNYALS